MPVIPIRLEPHYNPAFSRGFPPSDIASDATRNFQGGVGVGLALRGVPQTKLLQENVAQDLDNRLAAALMPLRVQGAGLQNENLNQSIISAPYTRAKAVTDILGEPGTITNVDTGPIIPVDNSDMSKTLRFAAPTGGGQVPSDAVSVGVPGMPGVGRSPTLRQQETVDKDERALERLLAVTQARNQGSMDVAKFKATTGGGLSGNRKSKILQVLGEGQIETSQFTDAEGNQDWDAMAVEAGKIERDNKISDMQAKLNAAPAENRSRAATMITVLDDIDIIKDKVEGLAAQGKAPSWWDGAVAAATRAPADGFFSALSTQAFKYTQGQDSKDLEAVKAIMSSALLRANAGLAQTNPEMANSSAFRPLPTDSLDDTILKLKNTRSQVIREADNLLKPANELRDRLTEEKAKEAQPDQNKTNSFKPGTTIKNKKTGKMYKVDESGTPQPID